MNLNQIIFFISISLSYRLILKEKWLEWFILLASIATIFWLQPISTIRTLDFWLPALSVTFGVISWIIVSRKEELNSKENIITSVFVMSFLLLIGVSRFVPILGIYNFVSVPKFIHILQFLVIISFVIFVIRLFHNKELLLRGMACILLLIFIILKNDLLSYKLSVYLRRINQQSINLALSNEIAWIGYSYIAFRIMHALIESNKRKGLSISLKSYLNYLLYFPAFLAGPIDRFDHFQEEILTKKKPLIEDFLNAGERIAIGLFQKFILADSLAIISINETLSATITSRFWMWFVIIVYAFRIYFDFNGYTNIAIGISMLLGIQLPENFKKPLLSPTLTIFWNKWHITLTQWFRTYYFNPLTRLFRTKFRSINPQFIMGFMQITTMVLIGLWHGISYNFIAWGVWNGIGLFLQNRITGFITRKIGNGKPFWQVSAAHKTISTILTFLYISLGWVWFALPTLNASMRVFFVLFGN